MKFKFRKWHWLWIAPILLGFIYLGYIAYAVYSFEQAFEGDSHQPDQQMISNFFAHQSEFELLRTMAAQDKAVRRIDIDWTDPPDPLTVGVSQSRILEYRQLFKRANIHRGLHRFTGSGNIKLIASAQGYVAHGSSKSYVYTTASPEPLHENLDQFSNTNVRISKAYRRIQGNWYLEYECD